MPDHADVTPGASASEPQAASLPSWQKALLAGLGSCLAILLLQGLGQTLQHPLLLAPFGASCVLLFVAPHSEFARRRNVLLSYTLATVTGFAALWLLAGQWWAVAVAVGVTIALMCLTRSVHPPAGAHPIVIVMGAPAAKLLLPSLALGLALLLGTAWAFHRFTGHARAA